MTIEIFLQTVFQISIGVAFLGLCVAGVAVSIYYSWKTAERIIKGRLVDKIEDSPFFKKRVQNGKG